MIDQNLEQFDRALGKCIGSLRKAKGLSQTELAEGIKVSHQQIQKYEYGETHISCHRLQSIADFLGVHIHSFFVDLDNKPTLTLTDADEVCFRIVNNLSKEKQDVIRKLIKLLD